VLENGNRINIRHLDTSFRVLIRIYTQFRSRKSKRLAPLSEYRPHFHFDSLQGVELGLLEGVPDDPVGEGAVGRLTVRVAAQVVEPVEVAREATIEPPAALAVKGAVTHVQVVVNVLRTEGHVVMVTQGVTYMETKM